MTLQIQFTAMISMIAGGFYLGLARDTFLRFSPIWKNRVILNYLLEIIFWTTQTTLLFFILYKVNTGELRIYIFIACLLGFAAYQAIAAPIYKKILERVIRLITAIYRVCHTIVNVLMITPVKWFIYATLWIIHSTLQVIIWVLKCILLPVRWLLKLIYNVSPQKVQKNIDKSVNVYSIINDTLKKWINALLFRKR